MRISFHLLKKYVSLPARATAEDVRTRLTTSTVEVEKIEHQGAGLDRIVVGKVERIAKHPNADKLHMAHVSFAGTFPAQDVVCGGTNLREGMIVAFAREGAMVRWHGQGELVRLEKAVIRGVASAGMICAADEIGLEHMFAHGDGEVADLQAYASRVGVLLAQALELDDVILHIDNKSLTNRPDLWSHWGIAREVAALFGVTHKDPKMYAKPVSAKSKKSEKLSLTVSDARACPRYMAAVVENIAIGQSPAWLRQELTAAGIRPINIIVDITNYVLIEMGQPLHAFDISLLNTDAHGTPNICVRKAKQGETLKLLDESEKSLTPDMLVIADSKKPVALAGIMGGAQTGISESTRTIVLEAANFNAMQIRKTSQALGVRTESSIRYEKALHPMLAEFGMRRALQLITELVPQAQVTGLYDCYGVRAKPVSVLTSHAFIEKRIGQVLGKEKINAILKKLGFGVTAGAAKGTAKVSVPWWRATGDIAIPEDLVEEVARMYGYDHLGEGNESVRLEKAKYQLRFDLETRIKTVLAAGCGMNEVYNYPWADEGMLELLGMTSGVIEIANPPAEKNRFLQPSLVPNMLRAVETNVRFFDSFALFEFARGFCRGRGAFDGNDALPLQPLLLCGAVVCEKKDNAFLRVKGIIEAMQSACRGAAFGFQETDIHGFLDASARMAVTVNGSAAGYMGQVADRIQHVLGFHNKDVAVFELDFEMLVRACSGMSDTKYRELPKFPTVDRDIAVCVSYDVPWSAIREKIGGIEDASIAPPIFLSAYDLGNGKKSVAFRVTYRSDKKTLEEKEILAREQAIIGALKDMGAEIR